MPRLIISSLSSLRAGCPAWIAIASSLAELYVTTVLVALLILAVIELHQSVVMMLVVLHPFSSTVVLPRSASSVAEPTGGNLWHSQVQ